MKYGIKDLLIHEGFCNEEDFFDCCKTYGTMPAICTRCGEVYYFEPDQDSGWCDSCESNTVKSALVLLDVI